MLDPVSNGYGGIGLFKPDLFRPEPAELSLGGLPKQSQPLG